MAYHHGIQISGKARKSELRCGVKNTGEKNMCSRIVKSGLILLTVFILASANLQADAAEDKTYKWRMATSYPAGSPVFKNMPEAFTKQVEEMSGGRMKIKVLPGGTVAPPWKTRRPKRHRGDGSHMARL